MERVLLRFTFLAFVIVGALISFSYSSGPSNDCTGGPFDSGQNSCAQSGCHTTYNINSGTGSVTVNGPSDFYPGESYTITVTVAQTSPPPVRYGFQTIALRSSNNAVAGSFSVGSGTKLINASGRTYIEHNSVTNTSGSWTFTWTAPNFDSEVTFYVGGLAANGSGSSGDYVYTSTTTIDAITPISITYDSTITSCYDACDGEIDITATSGGISPYTYAWSNGDTTTSLTGLCGGTYTVTVTDSMNHEEEFEITVPEPDEIEPNFTALPSSCAFGNGQISAAASGGTGGYTYQWNDSANTTDSVILDAGIGWFTVTITDNSGCFIVDSAEVGTSNSGLSGTVNTTVENCGQANGQATMDMTFGNPPYTYNWVQSGATSSTVTGLSAGTYDVIVTDNLGCQEQFNGTVHNVNAVLADSQGIGNVLCFGSQDGFIEARVDSGFAPFTFSLNGGTATNDSVFNQLGAGEHTLVLIDSAGCTDTALVPVWGPDSMYAIVTVDSANEGFCDATAHLQMMGGIPPYHYDWSHQSGLDSNAASDLCGGPYLVTVIDSFGCLAIISFEVPEKLGVGLFSNTSFRMYPNPASGQVYLQGVPQGASIRVTDMEGRLVRFIPSVSVASISMDDLQNGTYFVQVIHNDGVGVRKLVVDRK